MDDVQDYWIQDEQIAAMNLFLSKNHSLSLGLIMHQIGNDPKIVNKVNEGSNKGLFELAIHGWDHVDYTKLSPNEQKNSMLNANTKIQKMFATKSNIFIPPYDTFDNSTLKAMSELGIKIVSSATYAEDNFNGGDSIFNATSNTQGSKDNKKTITNNAQIYHLPATVSFKDYEGSKVTKNSIKTIIDNATDNINKYGYAVIVLHPQDFAKIQNGQFVNSVNSSEINDLSSIFDILASKNIPISSFSKTVGINNNNNK
jgi:peptidoglycan/xylan/chitin deacetylase (PgdA/CDA1 family)